MILVTNHGKIIIGCYRKFVFVCFYTNCLTHNLLKAQPLNNSIDFLCLFFSEGSRKMEHKGNSWHETCFTCQRCQQPIGTKSFIPKDNHNFCVPCYEKQFAMQCVHCKKVRNRVNTIIF